MEEDATIAHMLARVLDEANRFFARIEVSHRFVTELQAHDDEPIFEVMMARKNTGLPKTSFPGTFF